MLNKLSVIQLNKMSDEELDSLVDSLYAKYEGLKTTINKNVWVGDYGGVSSQLGIEATRSLEEIKAYILLVESTIDGKNRSYASVKVDEDHHEEIFDSKANELFFSTFAEAKQWSINNAGKSFTRSADGIGFVPVTGKSKSKQ